MTATLSRSSSQSGPLRGAQRPTRLVMPEYAESEWKDCHAVNSAGGIDMLEWQDAIMRCWLATNSVGRWAAMTCGGSLSRQNGKSLGLVVPRCNYGMIMLGEEVLYTSHLQKTSTETFESIAAFFDSKPLKKYVKDIKTALGREQVILKNGGRIKFLARTRNGGRGQHGDLLVFDEALELDSDSQASFLPAISASKNPQVIYVSSPPTSSVTGTVFRGIRERALSGESDRISWFEWSVDAQGIDEVDVHDRKLWYATNPSLGILIQESTVESEVEQMDADTFARERLGWWSPTVGNRKSVIDAKSWDALSVGGSPEGGKRAFAVKFSPDGAECVLAVAVKDGDSVHVEVVERMTMAVGTGWLADFARERKASASCFVIDGKAGAGNLVDKLGKMPSGYVVTPTSSQVVAACSAMVDAVAEKRVTWFEKQQDLRDSAVTSVRRPIGAGGGWGFGGENPVPIEAASLALWGVLNSKRNPERKMRIG